MLIGLVRDSVLQCFCHSCKAPLGLVAASQRRGAPITKKPAGKGKPRTKQPKKVKFITTEIRCQEKSKGGLCYEVILAEPTVPKRTSSPPQPSPTQQVAIEDKLRAAEERRLSLEAHKLAALATKLGKIEEASRKKDELSAAFISQTREALDAKMTNTEEKREAHIADLKSKLKEHEDQVVRVRTGMSERVQQLESQIQGKLDQARERRETIEREQKEKLRNHNTVKIAEVRQVAEVFALKALEAKERELAMRLTAAEINRQREIQRRVQAIRQHERRAEIVRQNKAALAGQESKTGDQPSSPVEKETASSG
ncbi:BICD family-like cargo adapter 1 isoform X3 [Diprion similis]|uniref:BICD family-like cargo adapter 1 isoform X3 n=1 Tax=Diprion similis TaxID=362088 RepID=UPI001EF93307|nr:BICD family-like cargo adapter 1 isoform X3 [Diprion similis]